ncbi:hypothetical protein [Variovorax saccharolyticus]|uniref:hypothetical protein n=1 Tax=Variovorax saccharolyticus TaxID=3053516 RepID=UPI002576BB27|nr:hypothetical protein [Variovorax sp. J22R187]MDM0018185.1 hypothetical protein [Variovorax sp. J22R187]
MIVPNATALSLVEAYLINAGLKTENVKETRYPIVAWDVMDGRAVPISLIARRADAIYVVFDPAAKCWTTEEGEVIDQWTQVIQPLWSTDYGRRQSTETGPSLEGPDGQAHEADPTSNPVGQRPVGGLAGGYVLPGLDEAPRSWKPTR